jgi:RNA polymerase sigma-70 factor (ECF subfamily)
MLRQVAGALDARRRHGRRSGEGDSVQYGDLTVFKEGARLQFAAFDASYLERLQRGEPATEQHFVSYFGELLRLKLRSRLKAKEAIEDVRQETFARVLALIRVPDGVRHPERLGALVNSVCNHVLLEHYRANGRPASRLEEEPEHSLISQETAGAGLIEIQETELAVRRILGDLPERDRRLLQAVLLDERDKDEICTELGLTRDYLRVLVHRAKQSFKSFYVERFGETQ